MRTSFGDDATVANDDCGGWPAMSQFYWVKGSEHAMLTSFHRTATNIEHIVLPRMAIFDRRREDNVDLRVQYCLNLLDESQFKARLEQRERKREFDVEIRGCLQLFVLMSIDLAYRLRSLVKLHSRLGDAQKLLVAHVEQVHELVNQPLKDIAVRFKKETPYIVFPETWGETDCDLLVPPKWMHLTGRFARLYWEGV